MQQFSDQLASKELALPKMPKQSLDVQRVVGEIIDPRQKTVNEVKDTAKEVVFNMLLRSTIDIAIKKIQEYVSESQIQKSQTAETKEATAGSVDFSKQQADTKMTDKIIAALQQSKELKFQPINNSGERYSITIGDLHITYTPDKNQKKEGDIAISAVPPEAKNTNLEEGTQNPREEITVDTINTENSTIEDNSLINEVEDPINTAEANHIATIKTNSETETATTENLNNNDQITAEKKNTETIEESGETTPHQEVGQATTENIKLDEKDVLGSTIMRLQKETDAIKEAEDGDKILKITKEIKTTLQKTLDNKHSKQLQDNEKTKITETIQQLTEIEATIQEKQKNITDHQRQQFDTYIKETIKPQIAKLPESMQEEFIMLEWEIQQLNIKSQTSFLNIAPENKQTIQEMQETQRTMIAYLNN